MIETYRTAMFVFIGALLAMFAFAGTNYRLLLEDRILLILFAVGIAFVVISLLVTGSLFFKELKVLEKMK